MTSARKPTHRMICAFAALAMLLGMLPRAAAQDIPSAGKRIIESYDAVSYGAQVAPIESSEGHAIQISSYIQSFKSFEDKKNWDWRGAKYYMVYIKNDTNAKLIAFDLSNYSDAEHQTSSDTVTFRIENGKNVYLDNGTAVTPLAAAEDNFVNIPANFEGYVKIPFTSLYCAERPDQLNYQFIHRLNIRGKSKANFNGSLTVSTLTIDTLSISYDDDIQTVFDKTYLSVEEDLNDGLPNELKIIKNFYLDNTAGAFTNQLGGKGQAVFDGHAMNLSYHDTSGSGNTIWTTPIFDYAYRNWLGNKYFVFEMKNNTAEDTRIGFYFSEAGNSPANPTVNPEHWQLKQGTTVYYRTKDETPAVSSAKTADPNFVPVKAGFDGYVIIPFSHLTLESASTMPSWGTPSGDKVLNLSTMYGVQFLLAGGTENFSLRIGRFGLAKSDLIRDPASVFTVIDESDPAGGDVDDGLPNEAVVLKNWYNLQSGNAMGKSMGDRGDVIKQNGYFHFMYTGGWCSVWNGDAPLAVEDRNWSQAKYMVIDVKNLSSTATRMGFYFSEAGGNAASPNSNPEHWQLKQGAAYYLRARDGSSVSEQFAADSFYIGIPAGFDGYLIVPFNTKALETAAFSRVDNILDPTKMYTVSFGIPDGTVGMDLKIADIAYAKSHNIRDGSVPIIWINESDPFIPVEEDPADDLLENEIVWLSNYIADQSVSGWASGLAGGGQVLKKDGQMHITYTDANPGDGNGASIWTTSFSNPANMNWTDGKYFVIDIKNNSDKAFQLGLYMSESGPNPDLPSVKPEQWTIEGGTKVIYRTRQQSGADATVTTIKSDRTYLTVPASFDGYICIRLVETNLYSFGESDGWNDTSKDGIFNKSSIYGVSWQIEDGAAGINFTLNGVGLGKSVNIQYGNKPLIFSVMPDGFVIPPEDMSGYKEPKFLVQGKTLYDSELEIAVFREGEGYALLNTVQDGTVSYRFANIDVSLKTGGKVGVYAKSLADGREIKLAEFTLDAGERSIFGNAAGSTDMKEFYLVIRFSGGATGKLYNVGLSDQIGIIPSGVSPGTGDTSAVNMMVTLALFSACFLVFLGNRVPLKNKVKER